MNKPGPVKTTACARCGRSPCECGENSPYTPLVSLPEELKVGGDINLSGATQMIPMPKNTSLAGAFNSVSTKQEPHPYFVRSFAATGTSQPKDRPKAEPAPDALRPATLAEYTDFIEARIQANRRGDDTFIYQTTNFSPDHFLIADQKGIMHWDGEKPPATIGVLVSPETTIVGKGATHPAILRMRDGHARIVPALYQDVVDELVKRRYTIAPQYGSVWDETVKGVKTSIHASDIKKEPQARIGEAPVRQTFAKSVEDFVRGYAPKGFFARTLFVIGIAMNFSLLWSPSTSAASTLMTLVMGTSMAVLGMSGVLNSGRKAKAPDAAPGQPAQKQAKPKKQKKKKEHRPGKSLTRNVAVAVTRAVRDRFRDIDSREQFERFEEALAHNDTGALEKSIAKLSPDAVNNRITIGDFTGSAVAYAAMTGQEKSLKILLANNAEQESAHDKVPALLLAVAHYHPDSASRLALKDNEPSQHIEAAIALAQEKGWRDIELRLQTEIDTYEGGFATFDPKLRVDAAAPLPASKAEEFGAASTRQDRASVPPAEEMTPPPSSKPGMTVGR